LLSNRPQFLLQSINGLLLARILLLQLSLLVPDLLEHSLFLCHLLRVPLHLL
jgi:hypothetical protein